jgi:hypothetical protein
VTLEAYNDTDPGFMRVTVDKTTLKAEYFLVPFQGAPAATPADVFTLNWKTHQLGLDSQSGGPRPARRGRS